jgi:hypothetical protein
VVALITTGMAGCQLEQQVRAGTKVQHAFSKLGDQKSVSVGVSFDASAAQLYTALRSEDGFTRADARTLAELRASLSVSGDKPIGDSYDAKKDTDPDASFAMGLSAGSASVIEVRSVNQRAYVRIDLKALEKLAAAGSSSSSDSADLKQLDELTAQADSLPASLGPVKALLKGKWVSIDPKAFEEFAKTMGTAAGSGSGLGSTKSTVSPKVAREIGERLRHAFAKDAHFKDTGSHGGADHVQVSVPARQAIKDVSSALTPLAGQFPGLKKSDLKVTRKDLADTPNRDVTADIAIKNGMVSAITIDLGQFEKKVTGKAPLVIALDGTAKPVTAPAGAVTLTPQDILRLVMSKMGEAGDGSGLSS